MKYGYFDNTNREYVIEKPDTPESWTNYLGVERMCTVISHHGGGYSFYKNPEHHRITRFRPNGVPMDRPGHYVYLRDDETGDFWSISWQPVGKDLKKSRYRCRHGLSYTVFEAEYADIFAQQLLFIPLGDDVEIWDVRVKNVGNRERRLGIFTYLEFSFHHIEIDNQNFQMSLYASGSSYKDGVIEYDFFYEPWTYHFFTGNVEPDSYDCARDVFIGKYRSETNPIALERGVCSKSEELGGNHCGALHKRFVLKPAEEKRFIFMLGVGPRDKGISIREKYSNFEEVDRAFKKLREYWKEKLGRFQCETPNEGLNTMINTWTPYQAETCLVWSRFASFIEVGGRTGLGYRDTAQDAMHVVHSNPDKCKQRILELLNGQTKEGYGLHLFDPEVFNKDRDNLSNVKLPTVVPTPKVNDIIHGLEDVCADDALWLIATICEYVKETGEIEFFNRVVPYADGGEETVYEHMKKIIEFSFKHIGSHGLCKGLRADWNDCLNLGDGESAMVSFMQHWALGYLLETAKVLGKDKDAATYRKLMEEVRVRCEKFLWDGEWYIRGITKRGLKIGSKDSEEGKIYLNSQSWAVYSGIAEKERGRKAMDAVYKYLFSKYGIHLLWPAYSKPNDEIGYVTRVYKGIKENASIFTHPNTWAVIAECLLGRGKRAMEFYEAILPYNQNDIIEIREAEPYSYCQFIYGRDHKRFGRARHPWLTGSAGWFYTAVTKFILGVRADYKGLIVDPCIPSDWQGFKVRKEFRGAVYEIEVSNPDRVCKGIKEVYLNGESVVFPIPVQPKGTVNKVKVIMG